MTEIVLNDFKKILIFYTGYLREKHLESPLLLIPQNYEGQESLNLGNTSILSD